MTYSKLFGIFSWDFLFLVWSHFTCRLSKTNTTSQPCHQRIFSLYCLNYSKARLLYYRSFRNVESGRIHQFFKCYETKSLHVGWLPPRKTALLSKRFVLPFISVPRSSHWRCSVKKMSLKIWEVSHKNTCNGVFLIKLQTWRPVT